MCPLYVSGLIGPGDRKSIQPVAERVALGDYDQLHHFIAAGVRDAGPVETELLVQADKLFGGSDAVLVIDGTAIPKKGTHSVGVAAHMLRRSAKPPTAKTLVSLTLARGEVPVMLALRLFLPESWTSDQARLKRAGVPAKYRTARTKPELALAEIWLRPDGRRLWDERPVPPSAHGTQTDLGGRNSATPQGLPSDVKMIWPVAKRGRPRKRHVPDVLSIAAQDMLAHAKGHAISWRTGTKGKLKTRFAAVRVRVADGPPQRRVQVNVFRFDWDWRLSAARSH